MKRTSLVAALLVVIALAGVTCLSCQATRSELVKAFTPTYHAPSIAADAGAFAPSDAKKKQLAVKLQPVATGFSQITDVQFVPTEPRVMVVLQKEGKGFATSLDGKSRNELFSLNVLTASEEGLLGLAFHPHYADNGRLFVNYVLSKNGKDTSRVQEFTVPKGASLLSSKPAPGKIIYEVEQPYPNHNGGGLQFGPDGFLYIGFGDGGYRDDPHGNGQNLKTPLGKMLRIDVDGEENGKPYRIPKDNPFVGQGGGVLPEIWAYGLRNPWRYSFDPKGRLVVADVGQDTWEEIDLLAPGANAGWNIREGRHCFKPKENCRTEGLTEPIYDYGRTDGQSVTGGYVYEGKDMPKLRGYWIFGDFISGRIWALPLPETPTAVQPIALGQFPMLISTFGRDAEGNVYAADFANGTVNKLVP